MPSFLDRLLGRQTFSTPAQWSISDPAFAEWLRVSGLSVEGMTEQRAASLSAFYRGEALISGTIASLPRKVYQRNADGTREEVPHFLSDNPAGPYDLPAFNWVETLVLHLLNHGESFLAHIYNGGTELIGLWPVHPMAVGNVAWAGAGKEFKVALVNGEQRTYTSADMTHIMGMTTDTLRGFSPLTLFRNSLNTGIAADRAANRAFTAGAMISGLVTTEGEEDIEPGEAETIKAKLNTKIAGPENAGDIAFVNRHLKFTPWQMTLADAQFIESRTFEIEEVARILGVPPHLLMSTTKTTSWGSGIQEQDLALAKYTLMGITGRIESAVKRVLPVGQYLEFQYEGLLAGTPKDEIELLIAQVGAGLLTKDEARALMNRPPLPKAETPTPPPPPANPPQEQAA